MDYLDILKPNADNPAGTSLRLLICDASDFDFIAKPIANPTTPKDMVNISGSHRLAPGKKWIQIELEINKNEINGEQQGAVLGGYGKQSLSAFVSNVLATQQGSLNLLKRRPILALVYLADGQIEQLGRENDGAVCKFNNQIGLTEGGERGNPLTLMAFHEKQFYHGIARQFALNSMAELIGQTEGFIWIYANLVAGTENRSLFEYSDGTTDNSIKLTYNANEALVLSILRSGTLQALLSTSTNILGKKFIGISLANAAVSLHVNGVLQEDNALATIPVTTELTWKNDLSGDNPFTDEVYDFGILLGEQSSEIITKFTTP